MRVVSMNAFAVALFVCSFFFLQPAANAANGFILSQPKAKKVVDLAIGEVVMQDIPRMVFQCLKDVDPTTFALNALNGVITLVEEEVRDDGLTANNRYRCGYKDSSKLKFEITFGCANETHFARYALPVPAEEITPQISVHSQSRALRERMAVFCDQFGRDVYRPEAIRVIPQ